MWKTLVRTRGFVALGYWVYIGVGSIVMAIVGVIASDWAVAGLAVVVAAFAIGRMLWLAQQPGTQDSQ